MLPEIERSAGRAFIGSSQAAVATDNVTPATFYAPLIPQGRVWVASDDGRLIGFAACEAFQDALHLWELAVRLDAQKQGAGRALVEAVVTDAAGRGLPAVTLTTFRDIAFNAPFYARLGFAEIPEGQLNPRLASVCAHEAELGLDVANRCAMRLDL
ncbi:MAG TPA: GNAT family N-acetyltransferase [Phenylobacterium sp.]|jgi:N-acetylglutamate synthase-like GNAT family acetyltransferase